MYFCFHAYFLIENFLCCPQVVGMSSEMFEQMQACYKEKFDRSQDVLRTLVPFDCEDAQNSFLFTLQGDSRECAWAGGAL